MIFFRVDCNQIIASGHLMRCISIAKELERRNVQFVFLISDSNSIPFLEAEDFPFINLNTRWDNLLLEEKNISSVLKSNPNSILFIDTYSVTEEYVSHFKEQAKIVYLGSKRIVLDGIRMLINYSASIDYSFYQQYSNVKLLLGPKYAPLRQEFYQNRNTYSKNIKHVLITVGNSDKNHFVFNFLNKFESVANAANVICHIVIGKMFDDSKAIKTLALNDNHFQIHENVSSMSELMLSVDLAISANGTTVYELAATSTPTISFSLVDEQVESAMALNKMGIVDYCGNFFIDSDGTVDRIIERFWYYVHHDSERISLGKRANSLISGDGSKLIVDAMLAL